MSYLSEKSSGVEWIDLELKSNGLRVCKDKSKNGKIGKPVVRSVIHKEKPKLI